MQRQGRPATHKSLRLDIQGLRALAVTLVVAFHLFPAALPGGYIGVDLFFVISGFLITGHLLREVETTGRIRVTEFWARRIRRLLPVSLLVLVVTLILTATLMPANTRTQNYGDIGFAAGYVLNWRLASNSIDYLNAAAPPSLVQHYWSLSIEEQFYIVWPVLILLVLGIAALLKRPSRRFILGALAFVFVASLAFSIIETARSQPSAYFLTTTRAWEFALGGLIAMVPAARHSARTRGLVSIIAVASIVACAFVFGPATPFPGSIALIPVGATAILIWCGDAHPLGWKYEPQRLTHNRGVQFVGDASYSIYLWHWPLILVFAALMPATPEWQRAILVVPATAALAWLSLRFVENPVRRSPGLLEQRGLTFVLSGAIIAAIIAVSTTQVAAIHTEVEKRQSEIESPLSDAGATESQGTQIPNLQLCIGAYSILNGCDNPHAYDPSVIDPTFAQEDKPWRWINQRVAEGTCTQKTVGTLPERACAFPGKGKQVLLIGDSHADQFAAPLSQVAKDNGWGFRLESRSACAVFVAPAEGQNEDVARCATWGKELIDSIVADPTVDVVLLSVRIEDGSPAVDAVPGFSRLLDAGKQVIVIRDTPEVRVFDTDGTRLTGPECLSSQGIVDDACSWAEPSEPNWLTSAADSLNLDVLDTHEILCPDGTCHLITGGLVTYTDDNHLTNLFALSMSGWFARELEPLVG
ncbi:acyltransferase [Leucobacter viscericola]|uniref:Acyltransferase n=1 Tax=Leucobacter viscericola TaxID=2714935 RepID=A0A6G7XEN8_9MICO|nr:acyltransferase family protein [Leucobacter viscericola]QIK63013.1 acyltransferase [Leucobacter viscericola]